MRQSSKVRELKIVFCSKGAREGKGFVDFFRKSGQEEDELLTLPAKVSPVLV